MNNIQKYIVLLLMVMLFVPNTAWAFHRYETKVSSVRNQSFMGGKL